MLVSASSSSPEWTRPRYGGVMTTVLLRGGRVRTPLAPHATALLVEDGAVAWVGADNEATGLTADETVRLGGAPVTPAFVDAHAHTTATGPGLGRLDPGGSPPPPAR